MRSADRFLTVVMVLMSTQAMAQEPINVGSRLELFVEDTLIERLVRGARLELHHPTRREVVFRTDAPWEGNASAYPSIVQDGKTIRLYYHGLHYPDGGPDALKLKEHPAVMCVAESEDGLSFRRPELGVCEYHGSKANNIVLQGETVKDIGGDPAHTSVCLDANPDCPPAEKYKTVILGKGGLFCLVSSDGIHWTPLSKAPIITKGAFDSQNLLFWDPVRHEYREYHRCFTSGVRDIMTATSQDVRHFPEPRILAYPGIQPEHLYTNQIVPYYRAPHLFVGFPMRYTDDKWSDPVFDLPGLEERMSRAKSHPRYGTAVTDAVFLASRDGLNFKRWPQAFIRPGPRPRGSWVYGDNMIAWGMVETPSAIEGAPNELSLYVTEHYWEGTHVEYCRYTLRLDGFVSVYAPQSDGEIITKPIIFDGGNLALNLETSGAGGLSVEIQDVDGKPIPGYALAECPPIRGDTLRHIVRWDKTGGDVRPLAGKPVRLRVVLRDADLYSFQFVPYAPEPKRPEIPPAQ